MKLTSLQTGSLSRQPLQTAGTLASYEAWNDIGENPIADTNRVRPMLQLRKLLTERFEWFETALHELAQLDGYGDLSKPMVQLCAHIGRDPVRITDLAKRMGTSRQWIIRLAREGEQLGILELSDDPHDRRAMLVGFSESGWTIVRLAVVRMQQIEDELAKRIGEAELKRLVELLSLDWGAPSISGSGSDVADE